MSQEPDGAGLPDSVEYQPLPNIYQAVAAGASPYAIVTEIIDNSIDFVRHQALNGAKYPDELEVSVRYEMVDEQNTDSTGYPDNVPVEDRGPGRLVITDNAGGVPPDELSRFFQLGHTDAPPQGIGRFGVGAKRLIGVGDRIRYESHANGYEIGAGYEVDTAELDSTAPNRQTTTEGTYRSDVYRVDDLDEGSTRIIVEGLNSNVWTNLLGRDKDAEIDESAADSLWRLGETYEHFLAQGIDISAATAAEDEHIDFDLSWGDDERSVTVEAPDQVEFSLLPFDGLHPRRYQDIPFAASDDPPDVEVLRADITVGLMPASDPDNAGLTVTMNNRNVLFRDTDNNLFSTRYLGTFRESAGHGRLYCVIELHGPPEEMPWSDTKDSLDGTAKVTGHLLNITENALAEYRRQGYDALPTWMLTPYAERDLEQYDATVCAELRDGIETIDKSTSKINSPRFNSKPGESRRNKYYRAYPERDEFIRTVRLHSGLRIRCDDTVATKARPAYECFFAEHYDGPEPVSLDSDACPSVAGYDIPTDDKEPIPLIEDIDALAENHHEAGQEINHNTAGVPRWLLRRYKKALDGLDGDRSGADVIEEFDFEEWRKHNSTSEDIRVETEPRPSGDHLSTENGPQPSSDSTRNDTQDTGQSAGGQTPTSESGEYSGETGVDKSTYDDQRPLSNVGSPRQGLTADQIETLSELVDAEADPDPEDLFNMLVAAIEEREKFRDALQQVGEVVNLQAILDDPPDLNDEDPE